MGRDAPTLEWARVCDDEVIVADARKAWLHRPGPADDVFTAPMRGPGSLETTEQLLEGAIGAGLRAARLAAADITPPPLTRERWVWRLCGLYHMTTRTPALLAEAEARFRAAGRPLLAEWAADRQREETGHDRLALRDLKALGYDGEALVARVHPPNARQMVEWFAAAVHDHALPLGALAYAHTVERLALRFGRAYLERVKAVLPPGIDATRCLRIHSAVGSDVSHVRDNIAVIARLPAAERIACALACRRIARLSSTPPAGGYRDQAELESMFGGV